MTTVTATLTRTGLGSTISMPLQHLFSALLEALRDDSGGAGHMTGRWIFFVSCFLFLPMRRPSKLLCVSSRHVELEPSVKVLWDCGIKCGTAMCVAGCPVCYS